MSSVIGMWSIFSGASTINQYLSNWCVTLIPSEPTGFALESALIEVNMPIWGTCTVDILSFGIAEQIGESFIDPRHLQ
jgi:hypothetical protein